MTTRATETTGDAAGAGEKAGTVTFLFSDIEGSTRLVQKLGASYADLLLDQRRILRGAIEAHGGNEIDTAGDGFFVTFRGARDALGAAVAAQRALAAHEWPEGARVRVRMGIHTGEPAITRSGDVVGLDVHRAARICAVASGGQVLLSHVTRQLVAGDLPEGVTIRQVGTVRLKDIEQPEPLFQPVIDGLESEFPTPAGSDRQQTNLPARTTPLIGREVEVDDVTRLLLRDDVRWVTLTGPGGTGKTRLALEVAQRTIPDFPDGVFLVHLAAITNPNLLASSIASALGLSERPGRPVIEEVAGRVGAGRVLFVLDNFEQIARAAPAVAGLLALCERLEVIVTSRVRLHMSAEYEFAVSPLPTPDATNGSLKALARVPAVALFVERASAARPGFRLTESNRGAIARICNQLEGLPLAIELAATRIRLFPPAALADRLTDRLNILKGGSRDLPERHQTLRHALQWSYELLGDAERRTFRRLGVFSGGATLDAIEAVCLPDHGDPLEVVAALLDHSLLRRVSDDDGEPRLTMLDTIREFALERLADNGDELAAIRSAHTAWCLDLAERAVAHLTGPALGEWIRRLGADHDNMRVALANAVEIADADTGLRLATALWRYWNTVGQLTEARSWLERVLTIPGAEAPTPLRAQTLLGLATIVFTTGDARTALPMARECVELYRAIGDEDGIATALNAVAWVLGEVGELDESVARSNEAFERHTALGNRRGIAVALNNLGFATWQTGEFVGASEYYEQCLAVRREIGDPRGVAYAMTNLAFVLQDRGIYESAARLLDEAITLLRELRDEQLTAWALSHRGRGLLDLGDFDAARPILDESLRFWTRVGNRTGLAWVQLLISRLAIHDGDLDTARTIAESARENWEACGVAYGTVLVAVQIARIEAAEGKPTDALRTIDLASVPARRPGELAGLVALQEVKAGILADSDSLDDAMLAATALGLAAALRNRFDTTGAPMTNAANEMLADNLRERLGSEAFEAALRVGAEEAVRIIAAQTPVQS
jgi:predicted ATPase/class 3 adenylate cyclase